ncbi:hypothetical protein BV25DRAFT_1922300 [Artomyces pyxidatus]|uniref:Uncharacterized protein n=1 Tax=Artomyces pyxidatus TaxID=48021 RepID=A0ACB8SF84_9AGAM|nr:hypothetical protein BV25DRAFT_1922300 [Artomyces pyxidatus]
MDKGEIPSLVESAGVQSESETSGSLVFSVIVGREIGVFDDWRRVVCATVCLPEAVLRIHMTRKDAELDFQFSFSTGSARVVESKSAFPGSMPRQPPTIVEPPAFDSGIAVGTSLDAQGGIPCDIVGMERVRKAAYVVFKGGEPGIYNDWEDVLNQVDSVSEGWFKGYDTYWEAQMALALAEAWGVVM